MTGSQQLCLHTKARRAEHQQLRLRIVPRGLLVFPDRVRGTCGVCSSLGRTATRGKTSGAVTARTNDVIPKGEHIDTAAKVSPASPLRHQLACQVYRPHCDDLYTQ